MSKREQRAQRYGRLGLVSSVVAAAGAAGALVLLRSGWQSAYNAVAFGPMSRRPMVIGLGVVVAIILGFLGFLGGLEAAAGGAGKVKSLGWLAFWIGVVSTMAGIALGVGFFFYKM